MVCSTRSKIVTLATPLSLQQFLYHMVLDQQQQQQQLLPTLVLSFGANFNIFLLDVSSKKLDRFTRKKLLRYFNKRSNFFVSNPFKNVKSHWPWLKGRHQTRLIKDGKLSQGFSAGKLSHFPRRKLDRFTRKKLFIYFNKWSNLRTLALSKEKLWPRDV